MSGGSYDYFYSKLDDMVDTIQLKNPERKAFVKHLKNVVKALHDIEWVDSFDYGTDGEIEAIMKCISQNDVLRIAIDEAKQAQENLDRTIKKASEK